MKFFHMDLSENDVKALILLFNSCRLEGVEAANLVAEFHKKVVAVVNAPPDSSDSEPAVK